MMGRKVKQKPVIKGFYVYNFYVYSHGIQKTREV